MNSTNSPPSTPSTLSRPDQPSHAQVLNDDRIDGGGRARAHVLLEAIELVVEDECIQRDVAANAVTVEEAHRLDEPGRVEIGRSRSRARARPDPPGNRYIAGASIYRGES